MHNYGLKWVDNEALFQVGVETFKGIFDKKKKRLAEDPFLVTAHAGIFGLDLEAARRFEEVRSVNKSLSNAIGALHQRILGLGDGWRDMEVGQGFDLHFPGDHPKFGGPVVAEVKNRFNTIKASDEAELWRKLHDAWKVLLGRRGNAYLIQINSKNTERYDRPWVPSGVAASENVRVCDGATAYERVFGYPDALYELLLAFPLIVADITVHYNLPRDVAIEDFDAFQKWGRPLIP